MKKTLVLFAFPCALLCAADDAAPKPAPVPVVVRKPTPKPAVVPKPAAAHKPAVAPKPATPTVAATVSIPTGATEVEPYLYRYQDKDGKKWLYRQTPFGIVKMEDKPPAAVVEDNSNPVMVTDQGESVKFVKKTPFGLQSWTRKKTELSDEEKALMQDSRPTEKQ
jgi:glucose/arabinose dehydrogenase